MSKIYWIEESVKGAWVLAGVDYHGEPKWTWVPTEEDDMGSGDEVGDQLDNGRRVIARSKFERVLSDRAVEDSYNGGTEWEPTTEELTVEMVGEWIASAVRGVNDRIDRVAEREAEERVKEIDELTEDLNERIDRELAQPGRVEDWGLSSRVVALERRVQDQQEGVTGLAHRVGVLEGALAALRVEIGEMGLVTEVEESNLLRRIGTLEQDILSIVRRESGPDSDESNTDPTVEEFPSGYYAVANLARMRTRARRNIVQDIIERLEGVEDNMLGGHLSTDDCKELAQELREAYL